MWLCRQMQWWYCIADTLVRSYHHRHASFGDAAVHDDYISALQDRSEIIVEEEGATLDEGSEAPAEVLHGRKHWVAHEEKIRQELKVKFLNIQLLV